MKMNFSEQGEVTDDDQVDDCPIPENVIVKSSGKRNYGNLFDAYMEHVEFTESPRIFCKLAILWAVAAAVKRHIWLDNGEGAQWAGNLYSIIIGPPGIARKSSALGMAVRLANAASLDLGPSQATWEALFMIMKDRRERLVIGDNTNYQSTPISFALDEVNTLVDFGNPGQSSMFTQWFDSPYRKMDRHTIARKKEFLFAPCTNIIGCTTTAYMKEFVGEFARGGGLMSRFLIAYGDKKYQLVASPINHPKYAACMGMFDKIAEDLDYIHDNLFGAYLLSKDAVEWNQDWYVKHNQQMDLFIESGDMEPMNHAAREQVKIGKIALLLAVMEGDEKIVSSRHLIRSMELVDSIKESSSQIIRPEALDPMVRGLRMLLELIYKQGGIKGIEKKAIMMKLINDIPIQKVHMLLTQAVEQSFVIQYRIGSKVMYKLTMAMMEEMKKDNV